MTIIDKIIVDASTPLGLNTLAFLKENNISYGGFAYRNQKRVRRNFPNLESYSLVPESFKASLNMSQADGVVSFSEKKYLHLTKEQEIAERLEKPFYRTTLGDEGFYSWLDNFSKPKVSIYITGPASFEDPMAELEISALLEQILVHP